MKRILFPAALAAWALSGCADDSHLRPVDVSAARNVWRTKEPASYSYTVKRFCECTPNIVQVVATRDSVLSALIPGEGSYSTAVSASKQEFDIDSLFLEVSEVLGQKYDTRSYSFDPIYGFPDSVAVDFDRQAIDEEYSLIIADFRPLP